MTTSDVLLVDAKDLWELRRVVLRQGDPAATVSHPHDDDPTSFHVATRVGGHVVACASLYRASAPLGLADATDSDYQLRFMAVDPLFQGRGLGRRVLGEGERVVREEGTRLLWANARDSALGFYRTLGWSVVEGSEFVSDETRLAHSVITKYLVQSAECG